MRHALDNAPVLRRSSGRHRTRHGRQPRRPRPPAAAAQVGPERTADAATAVRRLTATPLTRLARIFASPGPIYDPEGDAARLLALRPRHVRRRLPPGRHRPQQLLLPPDPGRCDGRERCPGPGTAGDPGRHRPDRAAAAGASPTLRPTAYAGTPSFLLDPAREGSRAGHRHRSLVKALVSGEAFPDRRRASGWRRSSGSRAVQCYGRPTSAGRLRERGGAGMIVDEAVIVEIVRPGHRRPGARRARSARCWSPSSIPTIR